MNWPSNLAPDDDPWKVSEDRRPWCSAAEPDLADTLDVWLTLFVLFLSTAYPAQCPPCTVTVPRSLVHLRVCVLRTTTGTEWAHAATSNESRMSRN